MSKRRQQPDCDGGIKYVLMVIMCSAIHQTLFMYLMSIFIFAFCYVHVLTALHVNIQCVLHKWKRLLAIDS